MKTKTYREQFGYQNVNEFGQLMIYARAYVAQMTTVYDLDKIAESITDDNAAGYIRNASERAARVSLDLLETVFQTLGIDTDHGAKNVIAFDDIPEAARIMRTMERLIEDRTRKH